jgi:hypothetical protein
MIPKKPVPDLIRDVQRFSDKIMRHRDRPAGTEQQRGELGKSGAAQPSYRRDC